MDLGKNTLTLSGVTVEYNQLPFFASGVIGNTDAAGVTEVTYNEYTFYVSATTLKYRKKVKGSRAASPMKDIETFDQLHKLNVDAVSSELLAQEEQTTMKLNYAGKQYDVPKDVEAVLRNNGIDKDVEVIEVSQLDEITPKLKGKAADTVNAYAATLEDLIAQEESGLPQPGSETGGNPAPADEPNAPVTPPATGGLGSGGIASANVFAGGQGVAPTPRRAKTEAEKEQDRARQAQERQELLSKLKESTGTIESLTRDVRSHELAEEAISALKKLVTLDGNLRTFRSLVTTNTRVKASVKNNVKPEDRVYHPALKGKPGFNATGKDIKPKYALGEYDVLLEESNPSSPSGFFIYIPESLKDFTPSRFAQYSERQKVTDAAEAGDNQNLVLKYYAKSEIIQLMLLTGSNLMFWNATTRKWDIGSPIIYLHFKIGAESGVTTYSLRAQTSTGKNTKLSVRHFIPLNTYNVTSVQGNPDFNAEITTRALFERLLMHTPDGAPANKFEQLTQSGASMFTRNPDGSIVYNGFQDKFDVPAYDNTADSNNRVSLGCPLVVMSTPTTPTAVSKPVFSKSKYTEAGYSAAYVKEKDMVINEIKSIKRVTHKTSLNMNQAEIAKLQGIHAMLSAEGISIK